MSSKKWIIIGLSGATCGGKSSLAKQITNEFKNSVVICQDNYFLPTDDPRHTKIPELNHNNWEILTSMDMEKMWLDIQKILESTPKGQAPKETNGKAVLIIDGFIIFKCKTITNLCDLKYFLTLTKETCWERRKSRAYDPPDVPGYFEKVVWPEYLKYETELKKDKDLCKTIVFIDGSKSKEEIFEMVSTKIKECLS